MVLTPSWLHATKTQDEVQTMFLEEVSKFGTVTSVQVLSEEPGGKIRVSFADINQAKSCAENIAGRWFDGRRIRVEYITEEDEREVIKGEDGPFCGEHRWSSEHMRLISPTPGRNTRIAPSTASSFPPLPLLFPPPPPCPPPPPLLKLLCICCCTIRSTRVEMCR